MTLRVHPLAAKEARAARHWYAQISISLANRFISELDDAIAKITSSPQQWSPYLHGTRVFQLHRFPYLVVYVEEDGDILILAVAHSKRRPGYWRRRLP